MSLTSRFTHATRVFALRAALFLCVLLAGTAAPSRADLWATGYYAGWMQSYMPASAIDYTAVTHIIHFNLLPNTDGSLDSTTDMISAQSSADLVSRAHAAGVPVLISVGGENTATGFRGATSSANRSRFVSNLVSFMTSRGYDGIDVDWEVLESSDASQFTALLNDLRAALDALTPRRLLTAAIATQPALVASVQTKLDQVNLMTYPLSGPWPGWVTWHNAPIYDGGFRFPSTGAPVPSADGMVSSFIAAGVSPGKLSIGIDFYGVVWGAGTGTSTGGATAPRQSWSTAPWVSGGTAYYTIRSSYFQPPYVYNWDAAAEGAYLSLDASGSTNDRFVSFDDETTCAHKVAYARNKGIGGVMIWELAGGYRSDQPVGQRDPLLQAIKQARLGSATPTPTSAPPPPLPTATPTAPPPPPTQTPAPTRTPTPTATPGATTTATPVRTATPTPGATADTWIYRDYLLAPWQSYSWGAKIFFNDTSRKYAGSRSIEIVQQAWGALSLHSGNGVSIDLDPNRYSAVSFAVNGGSSGIRLGVLLEDDANDVFPELDLGNVPANTWKVVSVPMSQLNPSGRIFHRVDIQHIGNAGRTFWVDELKLVGK